MRRLLAVLVAGLAPVAVHASICNPGESPFADVPDTSPFCSEALWLRNANVTIGCGNGTVYCPNDFVLRSQMALFMRRLVRAATPDMVATSGAGGAGDLDTGGAGVPVCTTPVYTVPDGGNPRIMLWATGNVSVQTDAAAFIGVVFEWSQNGTLFLPLSNATRALVPGNQSTVIPVQWSQTITNGLGALLLPGTTHQFRMRLTRIGSGTSGQVASSVCQLMIALPVDAAS
jgi:hypothetical protein